MSTIGQTVGGQLDDQITALKDRAGATETAMAELRRTTDAVVLSLTQDLAAMRTLVDGRFENVDTRLKRIEGAVFPGPVDPSPPQPPAGKVLFERVYDNQAIIDADRDKDPTPIPYVRDEAGGYAKLNLGRDLEPAELAKPPTPFPTTGILDFEWSQIIDEHLLTVRERFGATTTCKIGMMVNGYFLDNPGERGHHASTFWMQSSHYHAIGPGLIASEQMLGKFTWPLEAGEGSVRIRFDYDRMTVSYWTRKPSGEWAIPKNENGALCESLPWTSPYQVTDADYHTTAPHIGGNSGPDATAPDGSPLWVGVRAIRVVHFPKVEG